MNRRLVLLVALLLTTLRLAAVQIDPESWYRAVTAQDKPAGWADEYWQTYVNSIRNLPDTKVETNSVVRVSPKIQGKRLLEYLDPNSVFNKFLPARLVSAEKIPSPAEEAKAEQEAKLKAQANQGNGPLTEADMKGKPVYYAGSPEAEAQMRQSAKEQDKAVAKFKQSGAPGNGPISGEGLIGKPVYNAGSPEAEAQMRQSAQEQDEAVDRFKKSGAAGNGPVSGEGLMGKPVKNTGAFDEDDDNFAASGAGKSKRGAKPADFPEEEEDKRPLSQRLMNTGKKPAPAATVAPAARADDEDERPVASSGSKFSKPQPGQGTKKNDTLFKNQNQNNPPQHQAPNNFIGIWAYPKDRGKGDDDYRLVFVQLTGKDTPDLMSLKNAKRAGYVPDSLRYTTLSVYPE